MGGIRMALSTPLLRTAFNPATLLMTISFMVLANTWNARNDDWTNYFLCRISFLFVVSLCMSTPFRDEINFLPHRVSRSFRKAKRPITTKEERAWDEGCYKIPMANYNWDDDGDIVRVRFNLEDEVLTQEDVQADITPMNFELRVRCKGRIHVLKVQKLNNIVVPDESKATVKEGTGKVTLKLKKWYDSTTWRHLIDTGANPAQEQIAAAMEKSGVQKRETN